MRKLNFFFTKNLPTFFRLYGVGVFTIILTAFLWYSTEKSSQTNQENLILAKYTQTIDLCGKFNHWYRESNYIAKIMDRRHIDKDLAYLHQWLGLLELVPENMDTDTNWRNWQIMHGYDTISFKKNVLDEKGEKIGNKDTTVIVDKKVIFFANNHAIQKLFITLEDAKMMHKKDLLDIDYFKNFFEATIDRLIRAESPKTSDILSYLRIRHNSTTYDAYEYCAKIIMKKDLKLEN